MSINSLPISGELCFLAGIDLALGSDDDAERYVVRLSGEERAHLESISRWFPKNHLLEQAADLTLEELARYNIITYHEGFTGRSIIDRAFDRAGLDVQIVMSAVDSDVIKAYVEHGLGVGIVASVAYDPERDVRLSRAKVRTVI